MGHQQQRQHGAGGLWSLSLAVVLLWLAGMGVEGGLLEEKNLKVEMNSADGKMGKSTFDPLPCIVTERSGVMPCDTNPRCCQKDSPRIAGTDFCCPPGAHQYHFKTDHELICACAV